VSSIWYSCYSGGLRCQNGFLSHAQLNPQLDLFAWIRAHDMLDLRFLPYGVCHYHHINGLLSIRANAGNATSLTTTSSCIPKEMEFLRRVLNSTSAHYLTT
jgi:hypothetical protein